MSDTTADALEELTALEIHVLSPSEDRDGWTVVSCAIVDRWTTGRATEHIVVGAEVRAPDNWTSRRVGLVFRSPALRKAFFFWLRGDETIRRAAEALLAASRM